MQGLHSLRIANERALHVVNSQPVDKSIFEHRIGLVTEASKEFFLTGVRSIHMAVEHKILAAARAPPAADNIGARLFHLLPGDVKTNLAQRGLHVLRHLQFLASRTRNVDDIATHRNNRVLAYLGDNTINELGIEDRSGLSRFWRHVCWESYISYLLVVV